MSSVRMHEMNYDVLCLIFSQVNSTMESETTISRIAFSSCGHFLHAKCLDSYLVEQVRCV